MSRLPVVGGMLLCSGIVLHEVLHPEAKLHTHVELKGYAAQTPAGNPQAYRLTSTGLIAGGLELHYTVG